MRWSPPHPARATFSQGVLFSEAIIMIQSALIGIDLGKHNFHLHSQDKSGREVFRKMSERFRALSADPASMAGRHRKSWNRAGSAGVRSSASAFPTPSRTRTTPAEIPHHGHHRFPPRYLEVECLCANQLVGAGLSDHVGAYLCVVPKPMAATAAQFECKLRYARGSAAIASGRAQCRGC